MQLEYRVESLACELKGNSRVPLEGFEVARFGVASHMSQGFGYGLVAVTRSSCGKDTSVQKVVANNLHHGSCRLLCTFAVYHTVAVFRMWDHSIDDYIIP